MFRFRPLRSVGVLALVGVTVLAAAGRATADFEMQITTSSGYSATIVDSGGTGVITAAVVSLLAHFLVGASKALFTLRTWWSAGLEMTLAGVIVGGITYGLGLVLRVGS